jgi:N-ethylmaleimide reductase
VLRPDALGVQRPLPVPRELDVAGIQAVVAQFRQAALNAVAAGIDGVEVHGANGFLIDQFLRDGSNRRTDGYGGAPARRARLLGEITEAVCEAVGADRVGVRLSPRKTFNDMHDSTPFETFGTAVAALNRFGIAYLHLASEAPGSSALAEETDGITQALRDRFDGPLIVNGGYDRLRAARDIASGAADLVSFATAFIANPDLVRRMREGAPLSEPDPDHTYKGGARGYIDYPALGSLQPHRPDH